MLPPKAAGLFKDIRLNPRELGQLEAFLRALTGDLGAAGGDAATLTESLH